MHRCGEHPPTLSNRFLTPEPVELLKKNINPVQKNYLGTFLG